MEELQDAIEDAQYVNAIATQEEGPRPVLSWEIPTEEQLADWETNIKRKNRARLEPFSCDWYLSSAIGLYLFSAYLKEVSEDYLRINFLEEIIRWRKLRGKHRLERAKKIVQVYLKQLPIDDVTGEQVLPVKTQIDEYDLSRSEPPEFTPELKQLSQISWDPLKKANCLGLQGDVVDEVIAALKAIEKTMATTPGRRSTTSTKATSEPSEEPKEQSSNIPSSVTVASAPVLGNTASGHFDDSQSVASASSAPTTNSSRDLAMKKQIDKFSSLRELTNSYRAKSDTLVPNSVFDKLDALVVESLRQEYWEGFLQSEQYKRLRNFLWFQDRRVVPDDFFTMRVLGRGGFGSVIGKWLTPNAKKRLEYMNSLTLALCHLLSFHVNPSM